MPQTVPRFEDPAFTTDAPDPNRVPVWCTAPQLDFTNLEPFVINQSGEFVFAGAVPTLEQLITKALITERLQWPAYDAQFGSDLWTIIGKNYSNLAVQNMCERYVKEALEPIDLVASVDQIVTQLEGDTLYLHFRVISVAGTISQLSFEKVIR